MTLKITSVTSSIQQNFKLKENSPKIIGRYRYIIFILMFLCTTYSIISRINISIAIASMSSNSSNHRDNDALNWNQVEISYVLTSFTLGYCIMQIPGSIMVSKFGSRIYLSVTIFLSSILTIFIPYCARVGGWQGVCIIRFWLGCSNAAIFCSMYSLVAKWAHFEERGKMVMISISGVPFGAALTLFSGGIISNSSLSWPGVFYFSGAVGLIWTISWAVLGADKPEKSRFISKSECDFITSSIQRLDENGLSVKETPLKRIIFSMGFIALISSQCANAFGDNVYFSEISIFFARVYSFSVTELAIFSALPYISLLIFGLIFLFLNQIIVKMKIFSLIGQRKLCNTFAGWFSVCLLLILTFIAKDNGYMAVIILTLIIGMEAAKYFGSLTNPIDIAPNKVGHLFGIINTVGCFFSQFGTILVGVIVSDSTNFDQWKIIFWIAAGINFLGNSLFLIFGQVDPI